jgi:hypothetical protein
MVRRTEVTCIVVTREPPLSPLCRLGGIVHRLVASCKTTYFNALLPMRIVKHAILGGLASNALEAPYNKTQLRLTCFTILRSYSPRYRHGFDPRNTPVCGMFKVHRQDLVSCIFTLFTC